MKKSCIFIILISVIVAVLGFVTAVDVSAQPPIVECPCDFEAVAKDPACWTDEEGINPAYEQDDVQDSCVLVRPVTTPEENLLLLVRRNLLDAPIDECNIIISTQLETTCKTQAANTINLTEEEYFACQCALLEYTTALNMADNNVEVQGGPPYECFEVTLADCRQKVLTPIPTLNEWDWIHGY